MTFNGCVINANGTGNDGGGVCNDGTGGAAILAINNSTVSNNTAYHGAGICNDGRLKGATLLQINNTTLNNNSAGDDAGAILNIADTKGTAALSNCTISGNSAQSYGGGINNVAGLTISNTTFSGNSANFGGSIAIGNPVTVSIGDTVLKAGQAGGNIFNDGGTVISRGYNLSSDFGGGYLNGPGDQINTDPILGPLQDNGGPTLTHALLPGSPALNAGDPNFTPPPFFDQRGSGFDRVQNGRLDVGSYEEQALLNTPTPTATPTSSSTPTCTGCSVTSPNCGTTVLSPPTDFIVHLNPPGPDALQASDFTVNGIPADSFMIVSGGAEIHFYFNTSPAVQGENTIHIAACAFFCAGGSVPEFTCTFTYQPSTPTPTPTATPRPSPTQRPHTTPRPRPTPPPRP